jgi:probable F420-dependent oxidoreductase
VELGRIGVWWSGSWQVDRGSSVEVAAELEAMGYGAIWSTGGFEPGVSSRFERLLGSTTRIVVASGIVSIWAGAAQRVCSDVRQLDQAHPGRFLLGLGASHAAIVENYAKPYSQMVRYLDSLDAANPGVAKERRVLAALGPRMLGLAAQRSAGAHPYFVPVEHTARARRVLGHGPVLAPEVTVVVDSDRAAARSLARRFAAGYLALPNYANNLGSLGFGDDELADGGSDRLVDAVVAIGDLDAVSERVREHLDAGADHVCIQVLTDGDGFPIEAYRLLADALA